MDRTSTDKNGNTTHMERPANLDLTSSLQPPASARGVIRQLKHMSAGTDVPSTHLVSAHNGVGYGYIRTPGGDVFFDASAITNLRFDQLMRDMTVEFALDQAPYLRASRVTVVTAKGASGESDFENRESELPGRL
jgi:cold shock CspA family protein